MVLDGDPPIDISWSFHGTSQGDFSKLGITTTKVGSKTNLLLIEAASSEHRGDYTCTAKNPAGSVSYSTNLNIHGKKVKS